MNAECSTPPIGPGVRVGARSGPFEGRLDAELIRRYALATRDPNALVHEGRAAPAVAIATQIWNAQREARAVAIPAKLQNAAIGGVHGEHDVVLHRPIVPGEPLTIWVEGYGARGAGRNSLVTLRYTAFDANDRCLADQWWTTVYLGVTCDPAGDRPPDHGIPEDARERTVGTYTVDIDTDMARRYADVSGDWSAHHFDIEAARASGSDRVFLHGLCTMALCAQGVTKLVAGGDPERVRRVAVRFAVPAPLGEQLLVRLYEAGHRSYAFEAECAGRTVITHGRAELR